MKILRNRNYSILLSGQLISQVGNNLYMLGLPWYVYVSTGSKAALALAGFFQVLPQFLGIFTGVFVDRWNKRLVMVVSDLLRALAAAALFEVTRNHGHLSVIIALVLVLEFFGRFFNPAYASLLPLVINKEDLAEASGLSQSSSAVAQLVGTFGGGPLIQFLGAPLLFLCNAVSFILSAASLLFVRPQERDAASMRGSQEGGTSIGREWVEGIHIMLSSKTISLIIFVAMMANFGFAAFDIASTAWVKGPMHGNAITLSIVCAAFFIGMLGGGVSLGWFSKRLGLKKIIIIGLVLDGVLAGLFSFNPHLAWALPCLLIMGISIAVMNGALSTYMYQIVPTAMRGRLFGLLGSLSSLMSPVGVAVYGALMVHIPLHLLILLIGVPSIAAGLLLLLPVKDDADALKKLDAPVASL